MKGLGESSSVSASPSDAASEMSAVKTSSNADSSMKGKIKMMAEVFTSAVMEAAKNIGMFSAFAVVYVPAIYFYMNGAVHNWIDKFIPDPDADAPNFVKFGEAGDW